MLDFVLVVHVAVSDAVARPFGPDQVVDVLDALQIHGQSFEAIGDFAQNGFAGERTDFLEIGELCDFHAVQPDFPAQPPGTKRW